MDTGLTELLTWFRRQDHTGRREAYYRLRDWNDAGGGTRDSTSVLWYFLGFLHGRNE